MVEEAQSEAHVPAQQPPPRQEARFPPSHGHPSRPQRPSFAPAQGPRPPVGLIWRIRDRRSFVELRRRGRRAHHGVVTVTFAAAPVDAPVEPPRVGFAVSRKVGTAVVRNRIRRQIQAHLRGVSGSMGSGVYLFALKPGAAALERSDLLRDVDACLERLATRR
jgi:ribonuclease P protein component